MIMAADSIEEIRSQMREARATVRFRAISEIAKKSGNGIEIKLDQPEVIPILLDALSDKDRRVQRAAARALRPFLKKYPELIDTALPIYATDQFDGSFTHAGLLDIRDQTVWVPRFQATKGHAALLKDGNTDRFVKFEFFRFLDVFSGTGTISFTEKTQPEYLFRTLLPQCVSIMARLP